MTAVTQTRHTPDAVDLAPTGITGLDDILRGGLPRNRIHLIQGQPGSGKTTLALQFLLEGARRGETGLYITLSETHEELDAAARSHGWSLDPVRVSEMALAEDSLSPDAQYTLFHPSEVEAGETARTLLNEVDRFQPRRLVLDSLSEMQLLVRDPLRYRRQILTLKQAFVGRQCTVLLLDDRASEIDSLATGVILLEQVTHRYGGQRRRLQVAKMRAVDFRGGFHDMAIRTGGIQVFPRLVAAEHAVTVAAAPVASGVPELDALVGGGLDPGTSTLIIGPAGAGKSVLATQYVHAAARRGEHAAVFLFDEATATFAARAAGLGMDLTPDRASGLISVESIDPAELAPGEFVHEVRQAVEHDGARLVVIDSLNGYMHAMAQEDLVSLHLHELTSYLGRRGVVTLLLAAQHGLIGQVRSPVDVTYLADCVVLLRFFESQGAVRQAMSVVKRRRGGHEHTIRELTIGARGVRVGRPLVEFDGVLGGTPHFRGPADTLAAT